MGLSRRSVAQQLQLIDLRRVWRRHRELRDCILGDGLGNHQSIDHEWWLQSLPLQKRGGC